MLWCVTTPPPLPRYCYEQIQEYGYKRRHITTDKIDTPADLEIDRAWAENTKRPLRCVPNAKTMWEKAQPPAPPPPQTPSTGEDRPLHALPRVVHLGNR